MKPRFVVGALSWMIASLVCMAAHAVTLSGSGEAPDSLLESARPGEYFFGQGVLAVKSRDYAHAVAMYQVAASWAYKTAEYNLAVMYAHGEGVQADMPRALAWMALAAERDDAKYVQARDLIASLLDKDGLAQAEKILAVLLPTYGDDAALPRAKLRWHEVGNEVTGSHLGYTGAVAVGNASLQFNPMAPKVGKMPGAKQAEKVVGSNNPGLFTGMDIVGASAIDASIAYRALKSTDNPYDPRFSVGTAVVGPLIPAGEKNAESDQPQAQAQPIKQRP